LRLPKKLPPKALCFAITYRDPKHLAVAKGIDAHRNHHRTGADLQVAVHAPVHVGGVEVDVREAGTVERLARKGFHRFVDPSEDAVCLRFRDALALPSTSTELYLTEGLSCHAAPERLGLSGRSLARWVLQARMDQGQPSAGDQAAFTSDERQELDRLRMENRELRREKDFFQAGGGSLCERAVVAEQFRLI
jgi:hypothetical protein